MIKSTLHKAGEENSEEFPALYAGAEGRVYLITSARKHYFTGTRICGHTKMGEHDVDWVELTRLPVGSEIRLRQQ